MFFLEGLYQGIEKGLKEHGHKATQVMYCDQPQGEFSFVPEKKIAQTISVERSFHENLMPSLRQGVQHVTVYSSLPLLQCSDVPFDFAGDSHGIQSLCSEILSAAKEVPDRSAHYLVAVSIKSNNATGAAAKLDIIQLRTSKKIYILQVSEEKIIYIQLFMQAYRSHVSLAQQMLFHASRLSLHPDRYSRLDIESNEHSCRFRMPLVYQS
jgi:hypothetical protein